MSRLWSHKLWKCCLKKLQKQHIKKKTSYLIMGPGKTTTLFWLYHNFKNNGEYEVYSVPLKLQSITNIYEKLTSESTTKKILLLADLNECTPEILAVWPNRNYSYMTNFKDLLLCLHHHHFWQHYILDKKNQKQGSYPIWLSVTNRICAMFWCRKIIGSHILSQYFWWDCKGTC